MSRALYAGLSGTLAHQARMDVIANNLANVNTVGYKERRVEFADCFYQTLRAGSPGGQGRGTNPMQVGTGVRLASISVMHVQGAIESTGQPLDAAIEGPGFFVVSDGEQMYLTRDGSFALDSTGTLVMASTGLRVLGWVADEDGQINPTGTPTEIQVPAGQTRPAVATSYVEVAGNLDAGSDVGQEIVCTAVVYDSLGLDHVLTLRFTKTDVNQWTLDATCEGGSASTTLTFDSNGVLTGGSPLSLGVVLTNGAESPQTIELRLDGLTQRGAASNPVVTYQDGHGTAALREIAIDDDGLIEGRFSDGSTLILGQIAMANVPNVGGLRAVGHNLFVACPSSGQPDIGAAGTGNRGHIVAQALELSTVDITRAFVDMISTQRGFQANARVIAAANELLQDLLQVIR